MNEVNQAAISAAGVLAHESHRAEIFDEDASVYAVKNAAGITYLLIAFESPEAEAKLRKALALCGTVSVGLIVSRDGCAIRTLRKSFRTGDVDAVASFEVPKAVQSGFQFHAREDGTQKELIPLNHKLEHVLFEVHSALRDIDGLHASDALDEICKLIYTKIFDEENAVKSGGYRFQRAIYHSTEECSAAIRQLYYDAIADDEAVFSNRIPTYQRSRGVFRDPIVLSSQAITRTVMLLEEYDLSGSPVDIKGRAFQNVLLPATRAGMGQYFTPKSIISLCIMLLNPIARDVIVDPFCGSGHFLTAALDHVRTHGSHSEKQFHEFAFSRLHGVEKSDRMVRVAMTDMRLHGDGHSNIRCVDSLLPFAHYPDLNSETFDIVATNPPFGVDLPLEALSELGPFDILSSQRTPSATVSLEIVALDRCLSLLRPGGRMAIVLPDGILSNRNTAYVRRWLQKQARLRAIVSLPLEAFTPFGANIKTSILFLRKFQTGEDHSAPYQVFMADLKAIGHDSAGRPVRCDDFGAIHSEFGDFIAREGW